MRKKGYTLSEVLVALTVIGFISAMTIPTIVSLANSYKRPMFRSAYRMLEVGVAQLINDPAIYPGISHLGQSEEIDGRNTFCKHYANLVNTIYVSCNASSGETFEIEAENSTAKATLPVSFITSNGMIWGGFETMEAIANENSVISVYVDIDGQDKGKNKLNSDIFEMQVAGTGRINIISTNGQKYILENGIRD